MICFFVFLPLLSEFSPSHVEEQGAPWREAHIYASGNKQATFPLVRFWESHWRAEKLLC